MTKEEKKYLIAKEKYYMGNPIMSDEAFDQLEAKLAAAGSKVINTVGFNVSSIKQKFAHPSRMLSLAKIKAKLNTIPPYEDFYKWLKKTGEKNFIIEPKYDGNACNVIYKNGKLFKALTRGDGNYGIDITHIIQYHIPKTISDKKLIEVRGEVLIKKNIFNRKYSEFKNPRNYVAGILHRDDINIIQIKDLTFIPFEVKAHSDKKVYYIDTLTFLKTEKFKVLPFNYETLYQLDDLNCKTNFENDFKRMLDYRDKESDFLLDGFVIKVLNPDARIKLGENSHDPEWALAIKFEPKRTIATIDYIEWRLSRKSELIPIGVLEPIELEGTTVSRVSLYNYKFCLENFKNGVHGTKVELVKAGDIIPQVVKVVSVPNVYDSWIPKKCPVCGGKLKIGKIHLFCDNPSCLAADIKKFIFGVSQLGIKHFGEKTLEKLYKAGIKKPLELFLLNEKFMIKNGFGNGRSTQRLLEQIKSIDSLTLEQVLLTLGIDNLGNVMAEQIAKWYAKTGDHNFKGLQKDIIKDFIKYGKSYQMLEDNLNYLTKLGIKVVMPSKKFYNNSKKFYIELTGSPKDDGFNTKEEFLKYAAKFGFVHKALNKDSSYLLTNSYNSTSSKMIKANKLGIKIITYKDFIKKYKN